MNAPNPVVPLAQLSSEREGDVLIISVVGEIDLSNSEEVQARIMAPLMDASGLVLDMTGTTYLDSTGVRVLFRIAGHLQGRSLPLRIVAPPEAHTRRVLELTGLGRHAELDDHLDDARRAICDPRPG